MQDSRIATSPRGGSRGLLLCGALSLACGVGQGGTTTGDTTTGASTSGVPTTGSSTTGGESSTTGSSSTTGTTSGGPDTCGFICDSASADDGRCDVFMQDCPEGEKCALYAEGGGSGFNEVKCVPVLATGRPGEPCTAPNATCPGVGQSCVSLYEEGINPPKYKDVGLCVIPE